MVVNFSARFYYSIMSIGDRIFYAPQDEACSTVTRHCPLFACGRSANAATVVTFCVVVVVILTVVAVVVRFSLL